MNWISEAISSNLPQLIQIRRHLHRYPEISHSEFETANYIESQILAFGASAVHRLAGTSVVVRIGRKSGEVVAFRADIDALETLEESNHQYISKHEGTMHACGHDVHTTILLGLIPVLLNAEARLTRPVKLIFQQAEESFPSGAPLLIEGGVLENPKVSEIYGFHVWPELSVGEIGIMQGTLMGRLDGLLLRVESLEASDDYGGVGGTDAIRIAASLISRLRGLMSGRLLNEENPASISFGMIEGGTAPNRFANQTLLQGTLRALTDEARNLAMAKLGEAIDECSREFQVHISTEVTPNIRPVLVNSSACIEKVRQAAFDTPHTTVCELERPLHASEDFGWYLERAEGAYVLLGSRGDTASGYPLHSPYFNVDERVIGVGISLLSRIALA